MDLQLFTLLQSNDDYEDDSRDLYDGYDSAEDMYYYEGEVIETDDSSCFSWIGYLPCDEELYLCFRTTGVYVYYDFPDGEWYEFKHAESKGSWFNENIKGYYDYSKMENAA